MGYYVTLKNADWLLPIAYEDLALDALKKINAPEFDHLKRGGRYAEGGRVASWYSWMPEDYDKTVTSVQEILELLGFECKSTDEGTRITAYDSKTGQEDLFLSTIAEYVAPGSFIDWLGEDGERFRYEFDGKTMSVLEARIVYGGAK